MPQHILYCNDDADILVLDLPASISRAQGSTQQLLSTPALQEPYATPEPKGLKRDALLSTIPAAELKHSTDIQYTLHNALTFLREHWHDASWCHPRVEAIEDHCVKDILSSQCTCVDHKGIQEPSGASPPLVLSSGVNLLCCSLSYINTVVHNPFLKSVSLAVSSQGQYIVPARSTFLCATIAEGLPLFQDAVQCLLPRRSFDLILLDPPWVNRSVRRSQAYISAESQQSDPFRHILPTLSTYLCESGYIAVWITNKATIRAQVIDAMSERGFVLVEEWIWLKVTIQGEPVTPLDGIWRKPYELLLLFRRSQERDEIVRRVGIAVPDMHSRKPSLKSMFEQLLPKDYNALEVFARSLTEGWWSWGDEVLKFQHESAWSGPSQEMIKQSLSG